MVHDEADESRLRSPGKVERAAAVVPVRGREHDPMARVFELREQLVRCVERRIEGRFGHHQVNQQLLGGFEQTGIVDAALGEMLA